MKIDKKKVKRILVIGLSNIGDAVLTTPVIQTLRKEFPKEHLALLVGPRAFSVFKSDKRIDKKIIYDKSISWKNKLSLVNRLKQEKYDLVVDLRNTGFAPFLGARYRTPIFARPPRRLVHMKDRHLWKLKTLGFNINKSLGPSVLFSEDDRQQINRMLKKWQIENSKVIVAVAPGARNMTKRWGKEEYRDLVKRLTEEYNAKVIIVGDERDELLVKEIIGETRKIFNACGKTTIAQLAFLLTRCRLLISNDSAPMHLSWAVKTPVISVFGPTNHRKYAPLGYGNIVVHKKLKCSACERSLCPKGTRECMKMIKADEVFNACKKILYGKS